ncbi:MAG TPA: class I SAM-dependent methyltransferase [Mycobacteriales bacterium]
MTGNPASPRRSLARRVAGRLRRELAARTAGRSAGLPMAGEGRADAVVQAGAMVPFEAWERAGWHLTKADFLSPIPIVAELPETLWTTPSELPGIDMRDDAQVAMLREFAQRFGAEFDALPRTSPDGTHKRFFLANSAFESVDAEVYYSMLRTHKPKRIIEIGSGWSTLLSLEALRRNADEGHSAHVVCIEPYPHQFLRDAVAANSDVLELWETPLQEVALSTFEELGEGDFLFIDSSHVLKIGSDVQYEFLEILPRVPAGVVVHVHDIFLPGEYPRSWVKDEHRFWNEQYLLQAYLIDNRRVEVLWGGAWMHARHPAELDKAIASYQPGISSPGSFWFRLR